MHGSHPQQHPNRYRSNGVVHSRVGEVRGCKTSACNPQACDGGAVLCQYCDSGGVPSLLNGLPETHVVALRGFLHVFIRNHEGVAFRHSRERQHSYGLQDVLHRLRVRNVVDAVDHVHPRAQAENADGRDERPHKAFPVEAVVVGVVRGFERPENANAQQNLVADVCERMHALRQHRATSTKGIHSQLPYKDGSVASDGYVHRMQRP
mmetsp:Transcript_2292/g.4644  ORF Transcript_2292/g.4644 Transcript_2292/m.4644 type:complete len:207 (+) Transcript_2292:534-1154(+)